MSLPARHMRHLPAALTLAALMILPAGAKDVRRFMEPCANQKLCPWYQADVETPAGFKPDDGFSRANKVLGFFPDKPKLAAEDPLIYVRTTYNGDGRDLETQAANSNRRWKEMLADSTVERLADVPRAQGKGKWLVFRYTNPSRPRQAHERLAFGEHVEGGGQKFFYMVTISASSEAGVNSALPAWQDLLGKL